MEAYSIEMVDETDIGIEGSEDGLVLDINDNTLQGDVSEYLVPIVSSKRATETPLIINIQIDSISNRKFKQLLDMLNSVLVYFDTENILAIWYYEATDEKACEMGLKIQALTHINFSFLVH